MEDKSHKDSRNCSGDSGMVIKAIVAEINLMKIGNRERGRKERKMTRVGTELWFA